MKGLWLLLLPELGRFPPIERDAALRAARHTALDLLELLSMAAGLALVTAITRYGHGLAGFRGGIAAVVVDFVVALPLLAFCLGPFHLRRLRRGLREQLRRKGRP